jgi:hypothetical protein
VSDALQVVSRPEDLLVASRVKEFVEIMEHTTLDRVITCLQTIQSNLPEDAGAKLQLRGDEVFGRRLSISYFREQTQEEAECEGRYLRAMELREATRSTYVEACPN